MVDAAREIESDADEQNSDNSSDLARTIIDAAVDLLDENGEIPSKPRGGA